MPAKKNRPGDVLLMRHKTHKKDHRPVTTTRTAYERVWKKKGWELVSDADAEKAGVNVATAKADG